MRRKQKGYTIIEALLFLAISSALFSMTIIGMNGQINRSRFKQNMETIQLNINSVLDSVDKGYTLSDGSRTCKVVGGGNNVQIVENSGTQTGVNSSDCVFYGRDISICSGRNSNDMVVSTYLANNRIINQPGQYQPVNIASLQTTIPIPDGLDFVPTANDVAADDSTSDSVGCHVAALHQSSNENYQKVPRFEADVQPDTTKNPTWRVINGESPVRWCFKEGSDLKGSVVISQVNVTVNIGDDKCS